MGHQMAAILTQKVVSKHSRYFKTVYRMELPFLSGRFLTQFSSMKNSISIQQNDSCISMIWML